MTKCKHWDCGWCYAPDDVKTNALGSGVCNLPEYCPYLKSQNQMNEIQQTKEDADVVIINGVEYRKTAKPDIKQKVRTLYDICVEWNDDDYDPPVSALIFKIEKEWTPLNLNQKEKRGYTDGYSMGFDDALNLVRKTLK